jgi:hypothetical protein
MQHRARAGASNGAGHARSAGKDHRGTAGGHGAVKYQTAPEVWSFPYSELTGRALTVAGSSAQQVRLLRLAGMNK